MLATFLVNTPDAGLRRGFLAACARHVQVDGRVLVQALPPDWQPVRGWREVGGVRSRLRRLERCGAVVDGEMEYLVDGEQLRHAFRLEVLARRRLDAELRAAGLGRRRLLDERGAWIEARAGRPASS